MEATAEGYAAISDNVVIDGPIYQSMENGMDGVDACWIKAGPFTAKLARKRRDIKVHENPRICQQSKQPS